MCVRVHQHQDATRCAPRAVQGRGAGSKGIELEARASVAARVPLAPTARKSDDTPHTAQHSQTLSLHNVTSFLSLLTFYSARACIYIVCTPAYIRGAKSYIYLMRVCVCVCVCDTVCAAKGLLGIYINFSIEWARECYPPIPKKILLNFLLRC